MIQNDTEFFRSWNEKDALLEMKAKNGGFHHGICRVSERSKTIDEQERFACP